MIVGGQRFPDTAANQAVEVDALKEQVCTLADEADTVLAVLRALVLAIDAQDGELDPTERFMQALRDARSWVKPA